MVTSRHQHGVDAAYTTPATRAKWVRLHFLGAPLPGPFPGAQPVKPELPITPADAHAARRALRKLPSQLLPARLCAGELRPNRPLAHARPGRPGGRVGRVRRRHVDQRRRRAAAGSAAAPGGVSYDDHRKTAHLLVQRIGGPLRRNARDPYPGPTDSARHTEAPLVRSHRGYRAGEIGCRRIGRGGNARNIHGEMSAYVRS